MVKNYKKRVADVRRLDVFLIALILSIIKWVKLRINFNFSYYFAKLIFSRGWSN